MAPRLNMSEDHHRQWLTCDYVPDYLMASQFADQFVDDEEFNAQLLSYEPLPDEDDDYSFVDEGSISPVMSFMFHNWSPEEEPMEWPSDDVESTDENQDGNQDEIDGQFGEDDHVKDDDDSIERHESLNEASNDPGNYQIAYLHSIIANN